MMPGHQMPACSQSAASAVHNEGDESRKMRNRIEDRGFANSVRQQQFCALGLRVKQLKVPKHVPGVGEFWLCARFLLVFAHAAQCFMLFQITPWQCSTSLSTSRSRGARTQHLRQSFLLTFTPHAFLDSFHEHGSAVSGERGAGIQHHAPAPQRPVKSYRHCQAAGRRLSMTSAPTGTSLRRDGKSSFSCLGLYNIVVLCDPLSGFRIFPLSPPRTFSEAHREKLRAAWEVRRQKPLSDETKERMRRAKLGHTTSVGGLLLLEKCALVLAADVMLN